MCRRAAARLVAAYTRFAGAPYYHSRALPNGASERARPLSFATERRAINVIVDVQWRTSWL